MCKKDDYPHRDSVNYEKEYYKAKEKERKRNEIMWKKQKSIKNVTKQQTRLSLAEQYCTENHGYPIDTPVICWPCQEKAMDYLDQLDKEIAEET